MIVHGTLVRPDPARPAISLESGSVRVDGSTLAEVKASASGEAGAGAETETLIFPGFTDVHLHLPQFNSIGADGLDLLSWLERIIFPAEAAWADADFAGQMTERAAKRLLAAGTTGIAAYATVHHQATRAAMRILADIGFRGVVGQVLMDQQAPADLLRPAPQLLVEAASLQAIGRIEPAVTPRFAVSCSQELLAGAGRLARQRRWTVQTHLAETVEECSLASQLHGGLGYTLVYELAGLLTDRTILAHAIWLSGSDRALLGERGAIVAHCPTANLFLRAGGMDLRSQDRANVRIGLGSDVAGGPDVSMVRVARAMIETAKRLRPRDPAPTAERAWWTITRGNALAMGWRDGGLLRSGSAADLVIARPDIDWRSAPDPLGALLYAWDDRWIRTVILGGRVAFEGR